MLSKLSIQNYALIATTDFCPTEGLNIITGETGAGKSIMLGALGLLLGNRADTKVLLNPDEKCIVEGTFEIANYALKPVFEANDVDYEAVCIIRREINQSGKSRAFVNDTPVTLEVLRELGDYLMDIHSQHETLGLATSKFQFKLIDTFSNSFKLLDEFKKVFADWKNTEKELLELKNESLKLKQEQDYNEFLHKELKEAAFEDENEQEKLENDLKLLENAEEIKLKLVQISEALSNEELGALIQIKTSGTLLNQTTKFSAELSSLAERLESVRLELKDIANELETQQENIEHDPEKLVLTKSRLDLLYRLQTKHQVKSIAELIAIETELSAKLANTYQLDDKISALETQINTLQTETLAKGKVLSDNRKKHTKELQLQLKALLAEVGMPNSEVNIELNEVEPTTNGIDSVKLLFSANKGISAQEISKVASGGEFSRLMLCIKYILAEKSALPTIIFDEIDTGVSGEIALKVGKLMQKMAKGHQLITITHLPQMAAKGNTHFFVYKADEGNKTTSKIKQLNADERLVEIAQMIGGENPSAVALESAKELISG
jgi:DNA repair protein RecN (Recombination protein N)